MSEDQGGKKELSADFTKFIEENKEVIRELSDLQPKTIKPNDEWAEEHEWDEMNGI